MFSIANLKRHDVYGLVQWDDPRLAKKGPVPFLRSLFNPDGFLTDSFRVFELNRLIRLAGATSRPGPLEEQCTDILLELIALDRATRAFLCPHATDLATLVMYRRKFGTPMMFQTLWIRMECVQSLEDFVADVLTLVDQGLAFHDPRSAPHAVARRMEETLLAKCLTNDEALRCLERVRPFSPEATVTRRALLVTRASEATAPLGAMTLGQLVADLTGSPPRKRQRLKRAPLSVPSIDAVLAVVTVDPTAHWGRLSHHIAMCQHWMEETLPSEGDTPCASIVQDIVAPPLRNLSYRSLLEAVVRGRRLLPCPDYVASVDRFVEGIDMPPALQRIVASKRMGL